MNYEILFSFSIASIVLTLIPGPDIIFVFTESITKGAKYGIGIALGLVSGLLLHTIAAAVGLSIIIQKSETLFTIIKVSGAFYLFFLAYQSYSEKTKAISVKHENPNSLFSFKRLFFKGILMNVLNPKVSIFFIAFFPKFLFSNELDTPYQFFTLGFIFILQAFLIFTLVSVFASKITFFKTQQKNEGSVKFFKTIVYLLLGIYILI